MCAEAIAQGIGPPLSQLGGTGYGAPVNTSRGPMLRSLVACARGAASIFQVILKPTVDLAISAGQVGVGSAQCPEEGGLFETQTDVGLTAYRRP